MIVPPAPASLSSSRRVAQARRSWRNLTKIGRGSVGGRATFCRLPIGPKSLARGRHNWVHRVDVLLPPKTSLTAGNDHDQADQAANAATERRPHYHSRTCRGIQDVTAEDRFLSQDLDGNSSCADREEFPIKSGNLDLDRAVSAVVESAGKHN